MQNTARKTSFWRNPVFRRCMAGILVVALLTGIVMPIVFYTTRNSKRMPELNGLDPDYEPAYYRVSHDDAAAGILRAVESAGGEPFPAFAQQDGARVRIPFESVRVQKLWRMTAVLDEGEEPTSKPVMIAHCTTYSKEGDKSVPTQLYVLAADGVSMFSASASQTEVAFSPGARLRGYEAGSGETACTVAFDREAPAAITFGDREFEVTELKQDDCNKTYYLFELVVPPTYVFESQIKDIYVSVQEGGYYSVTYFDESVWNDGTLLLAVLRFVLDGKDCYVIAALLSTQFARRSGGTDEALAMNRLRIGDRVEIAVQTTPEEFSRTLYTAAKVTVLSD